MTQRNSFNLTQAILTLPMVWLSTTTFITTSPASQHFLGSQTCLKGSLQQVPRFIVRTFGLILRNQQSLQLRSSHQRISVLWDTSRMRRAQTPACQLVTWTSVPIACQPTMRTDAHSSTSWVPVLGSSVSPLSDPSFARLSILSGHRRTFLLQALSR